MNINAQRRIVAGVGGGGVYVGQYTSDGLVPMTRILAAGGGPSWWVQGRILANCWANGPAQLSSFLSDGSSIVPVTPTISGATSSGVANDGASWALYLADQGRTGVQTSWGLSLPTQSWLGIGPALFVKPPAGNAITAYDIGSLTPRWTLENTVALDFFAIDAETVIWTNGANQLETRQIPTPPQFESINNPSAFYALGQWWLMYGRGQGGAVIRPWNDATHGYIVVPVGQNAFGACCVPGDDPTSVIAFWSPNAGETVIQALTINLTAPMQDLTTPVPVPSFHFNHNVLIAPFKTGSSGQPGLESLGAFAETEGDLSTILAANPHQRVTFAFDAPTAPVVPRNLPAWALFLVELYRLKGETIGQSVARWIANMQTALRIWPGDVGAIPMCYGQGGAQPHELWSVPEILEGLTALSQIVNMNSRIKVIAPFAYARLNGIMAHPELMDAFLAMVQASPGVPVLAQPPALPAPDPIPVPVPVPIPAPAPTPTPPPEVPKMPSQLAFSLNMLGIESVPNFSQQVGVSPHPDGHGLSALAYLDGSGFASLVLIGGQWKKEPTAGAGERFLVNAGTITAYRSNGMAAFPAVPIVAMA